ncbi:MAG: hypothetical protein K0R75_1183 [Paenibacillaceae bacterium]|jgi:hypothetical protein|nr:hypothetical protein [Paenibacillaceae bacterium]
MRFQWTAIASAILALSLLAGCDKDEAAPNAPSAPKAPENQQPEVVVPADNRTLSSLDMLTKGFPKFVAFRNSEAYFDRVRPAGMVGNEALWMDYFSKNYDGIIGKVLLEENQDVGKNLPVFVKYKEEHPEKTVLLHFNARAKRVNQMLKDMMDGTFFPGHILYQEGSKGVGDIAEAKGETTLKVEDADKFFHMNWRGANMTYQGGQWAFIVNLLPDGKPDWYSGEYVYLTGHNIEDNTLQAKRGLYGTPVRSFKAGQYVILPCEGGSSVGDDDFNFVYNYSVDGPKDKSGRNGIDALVDFLGKHFETDLKVFDGIAMDVLQVHEFTSVDADGDLVAESGLGMPNVELRKGLYEFAKKLRQRLGPDKLITVDGQDMSDYVNVGSYFNGMESEGWPFHQDLEVSEWSSGLNRTLYYQGDNVTQPRFTYFVSKMNSDVDRNKMYQPSDYWRLFNAAAAVTKSVVAVSSPWKQEDRSAKPPDKMFDELVKGAENVEGGWLGQPIGPLVRLAASTPDLLEGQGVEMSDSFISMFSGDRTTFAKNGGRLAVSSQKDATLFRFGPVDTKGMTDITLFFTISMDPDKRLYDDMRSELIIKAYDPSGKVVGGAETGGLVRKGLSDSPIGKDEFEVVVSYRDLKADELTLEFSTTNNSVMYLSKVTAHNAPDAVYREFEHGLVIANPSRSSDYTFDTSNLPGMTSPGRKYKRIQGTPYRDEKGVLRDDSVKVNTGQPVTAPIQLTHDALFLDVTD